MEFKPYPNEHSARIINPDEFIKDSFRRKNIAEGIDIIIGKLKKGDGSMVTQAYRFNAKKFTIAQAKAWLKNHDIKYISFEPAKEMNTNEIQFKSLVYDVKDIDATKGIVTFYFSIFGNKDADGDIVERGAFAKTIAENFKRIKHFKNHRWDQLVGVPVEIKEDDSGALARSQIILGTQLGKDTFEEYKAGGITEHSFGFDVLKFEQVNEDDPKERTRILKELRLWEFSSLTSFGSNPLTRLVDLKTMDVNDSMLYLERLLKLKKGDFSDEYFRSLEQKIIKITDHIKSLIEPSDDTHNEPVDWIEYFRNNLKILQNG
jgi:HK97 family phage prohead protease